MRQKSKWKDPDIHQTLSVNTEAMVGIPRMMKTWSWWPWSTPQLASHTPASPAFLSLKLSKHLPTLWPLSYSLSLEHLSLRSCICMASSHQSHLNWMSLSQGELPRCSSWSQGIQFSKSQYPELFCLHCTYCFLKYFSVLNVYWAFYSVIT